MGCSVRTPHVRYTEWRDWETGKLVGRELYDHRNDPAETISVADDPSADAAALAEARRLLHAQFPPDVAPASK
jgi:iduronate 2-sulfatase